MLWGAAMAAAGSPSGVLVEACPHLLQEWLLFPIPGSKAWSTYCRANQNTTYLEMLKSMSAVHMSIPLLPEGQAHCSPGHLQKADR